MYNEQEREDRRNDCLPRERIMDSLDELEITDGIAAQSRCEIGGKFFELLQMFP